MIRILYIPIFLLFSLLAVSCTSSGEKIGSQDTTSEAQPSLKRLFLLYKNGNYFKLRDRLRGIRGKEKSDIRFLTAVTYNAFNKPARSNQIITHLLSPNVSLADSLTGKLLSLKLTNYLRLYQYRKASNAAMAIIDAPDEQTDSAEVANAKNMSKLLKALSDAPPQKISIRETTTLPINKDKANLQRIPVRIGGTKHHFVFDTGAGFSTIMQSVAKEAGLKIKKVGVKVKSATGGKVRADIAVAGQVVLGHVHYRNVVFLVLPDKALTFPQIDYRIPGIIGFPVIEAAGEIQFLQDSLLRIPANPSDQSIHNLALKGLSPRVLTGIKVSSQDGKSIQADSLVCTLDTGAKSTMLLAPFYRRYQAKIEQIGRRDTIHIGGAGKATLMPVYRLPKVQFQIGKSNATLNNVIIYINTTFENTNSSLACNIGQDVLTQFDKIIINFKSMSLLLR